MKLIGLQFRKAAGILFFVLLIPIFGCSSSIENSPSIVTYPAPPGLTTSPDFTMKTNGKTIWVERIYNHPETIDYTVYGSKEMEDLNVAGFSCSGKVDFEITASEEIKSFLIRPASRQIKAEADGNTLTFTVEGPQKLYIEGGAIVYADVRGKDLQNVTIKGRGMLQGNVKISGTSNLHVSGIFIRNTKGWTNTLSNCRNSSYRNVKVFGYGAIWGLDGINPVSCRNFTIDDCFMRCRDDCVAIKSMDPDLQVDSIFVTNNVMIGWSCSDGVTLGYELNGGPVQNILVKNCDILYARGGGRTDGHSGFSIVCDGPAWVKNIRFEDITFEHCYLGDQLLSSTSDAPFQINTFVSDIKFLP